MSLFGAMTTAIGGLTAQSRALGHISDNVANSQTIGYKRVDTNFVNFVTSSSQRVHQPGSVSARPAFQHRVQGAVEQVNSQTALAISGDGFFGITRAISVDTNTNLPIFDTTRLFTRAGDFALDRNGYLVNGADYYLLGWPVDQLTMLPNQAVIEPVRVTQMIGAPVATSQVDLSANLPANSPIFPTPGSEFTTTVGIYDPLGNLNTASIVWRHTGPNQWEALFDMDSDGTVDGAVNFQFAVLPNTPGSIQPAGITNSTPPVAAISTPNGTGDPASITVQFNYNSIGNQNILFNFGRYNQTAGLTQFAGTELEVRSVEQNGVPPGAFSSVSVVENGDVIVNYDNGQRRTIYRVPLFKFADPNRLDRRDGQAFAATQDSGAANPHNAGTQGTGSLVVSAVERSNVDIAQEFTRLIVAQRAYAANTRIVSTSDEMMMETLNMKR
jgi:flagellar hook protein FlgE